MQGEAVVRFGFFVSVFALMAIWETLAPARARSFPRAVRWPSNFAVVALDAAILRFVFPVAAVGVAALAAEGGFGLFNALAAPRWVSIPLSLVALDFVIWLQHVTFHRIPALWRFHRMHHADLDFDVTTALRFHPVEIALSMLIKMAAVAVLGAPPVAVVAFEIALNALAMFDHCNASLPPRLDALVRLVFVTPDMHRVHHSVRPEETNSNFGFNLSIWDRLSGLYRPAPRDGKQGMTVGLPVLRDPAELRLDRMLTQPWRGKP